MSFRCPFLLARDLTDLSSPLSPGSSSRGSPRHPTQHRLGNTSSVPSSPLQAGSRGPRHRPARERPAEPQLRAGDPSRARESPGRHQERQQPRSKTETRGGGSSRAGWSGVGETGASERGDGEEAAGHASDQDVGRPAQASTTSSTTPDRPSSHSALVAFLPAWSRLRPAASSSTPTSTAVQQLLPTARLAPRPAALRSASAAPPDNAVALERLSTRRQRDRSERPFGPLW